MYTPLRWQQRYQHFIKALSVLQGISEKEALSEAEAMGLIQAFEVSFELAWKTMQDYLRALGTEVAGPREVIKQAFSDGIITNADVWIEALYARNETTHTYDSGRVHAIAKEVSSKYITLFNNLSDFLKEKYDDTDDL